MFEKLSSAAEKLATNVSESRRGFLARVGHAALGVAGVAAGLLALPTQAYAARSGYCQTSFHGLTGYCVCANPCTVQYDVHCLGSGYYRFFTLCGRWVVRVKPCTCT